MSTRSMLTGITLIFIFTFMYAGIIDPKLHGGKYEKKCNRWWGKQAVKIKTITIKTARQCKL